jgi:7-cyano-7-deazaguanine synthase in queuosine biosynthesis/predicted MPP superfamily phosphohydrolase
MHPVRFGSLPRTRSWRQVVDLLAKGAEVDAVADATWEAAARGLRDAERDPVLAESLWHLVALPLFAREKDFLQRLRAVGVHLQAEPTQTALNTAFSDAIDARARLHGGRTDLGEMAQLAAVEAMTAQLGARIAVLGSTPTEVRRALAECAVPQHFGELLSEFFARLMRRFLMYFLSRELSNHVGPHERFDNADEHSEFHASFDAYCREATRDVAPIARDWLAKLLESKEAPTRARTAKLLASALAALVDEPRDGPRAQSAQRHVICGRRRRARGGDDSLLLDLHGERRNVELRFSALGADAARKVPDVFVDLVEIAAYVYCADQATTRGRDGALDMGARWRRRFRFSIPVRRPDLWSQEAVTSELERTLGLLSDDEYTFEFVSLPSSGEERGLQRYLDGVSTPTVARADEVVLFSGGLDSFAGAAQESLQQERAIVLLSHRVSPRVEPQQRALVEALRARSSAPIVHVPVWLQRDARFLREQTQRTRAFLYAALGAAVARSVGCSSVRFFENGVVSFNLPISAQVIGARASRSTHPQVIEGFARLFSRLARAPFSVDNGFVWKTKAEVARLLSTLGCQDLLATTVSCARPGGLPAPATHCGVCSQCIDRRFATLAASLGDHDPAPLYAVDLLSGPREQGDERTVLESYVRAATDIAKMSDTDFFARYGELSRVIGHLPGSADENATRIVALHRKHGEEVESVLDEGIRRHAKEIRKGELPESSLLMLTLPKTLPPPSSPAVPSAGPRSVDSRDTTVRILHLSDFHFSRKRAWDSDPVLGSLHRDVAALVAQGLSPHLVAITGDLADRGSADELAMARAWLCDRLLPAARLLPESLVMVPGNHDVDRSAVKKVVQAAQAELLRGESQEAIAAVLADEDERGLLLKRFSAWMDFVAETTGRRKVRLPWWSETRTVGDVRLHLAGFSSSWMSWCDEDKGRLLLSRYQAHALLEGADQADLSIALMHHPWDYLADFDESEVREAVHRRCAVVLRGHLHKSEGSSRSRPDDQLLELACGSCYAGSKHGNGYQLVELDVGQGVARVHMRAWDGHDWIADRNAYRGRTKDGVATFSLRKSPRLAER